MTEAEIKQRVRQFYDRVGWQTVADGTYQNARYEDMRPVSHEYIHRCHLRVNRFLKPAGRYLLDAGSGPVQYPEYLTYSENYTRRVCVDISIVALQEARRRIGEHGLFVVADVANLPFKDEPFEGVVSLHTLHHLPLDEQVGAYGELYRVLRAGCTAVVVNGWTISPLMRRMNWLVLGMERLGNLTSGLRMAGGSPGKKQGMEQEIKNAPASSSSGDSGKVAAQTGTFIRKLDANWLKQNIGRSMRYKIYPWRSVSVRFLRAVVHQATGGRIFLRLLFWLEDRFPRFFGEKGQYPLIVIYK